LGDDIENRKRKPSEWNSRTSPYQRYDGCFDPTERLGGKTKPPSSSNTQPALESVDRVPSRAVQFETDPNARTNSLTIDVEMALPKGPKKMGPGPKDVRYVRRELRKLVNCGTSIAPEIEEIEMLLAQATKITDGVSKDIGELVWIRHHVEEDFMKLLKEDRTLWDGTRLMEPETREGWEEYLRELQDEKDEKDRLELEMMAKEEQEEEQRQRNEWVLLANAWDAFIDGCCL